MSDSIQIIDARHLAIGDTISWKGEAAEVGDYREAEMQVIDGGQHYAAVELTLFYNNDEDREEKAVVPAVMKIRVLSPKRIILV